MAAFLVFTLPLSVVFFGGIAVVMLVPELLCRSRSTPSQADSRWLAISGFVQQRPWIRTVFVRLVPLLAGGIIGLHMFESRMNGSAQASVSQLPAAESGASGGEMRFGEQPLPSSEPGRELIESGRLICGECHQFAPGPRTDAPRLHDVGSRLTRDQLVAAILAPSMTLARGFGEHRLLLVDGKQLNGVLESENEDSVVLRLVDGERIVVPTHRIETQIQLGSPMPDGLTDGISAAEFWRLIDYLESLRGMGIGDFRAPRQAND